MTVRSVSTSLGLVGLLLVCAGCSSAPGAALPTSSSAVRTSVIDTTPVVTRPPVLTLPGETELQAINRILLACWKDFGLNPVLQPDGSYKTEAPTPEIAQQATTVCQQRLVDAGLQGDFPLTDEQIRNGYDAAVKFRACIIALGYDLPPLISFEEWAASRGKSPKLSAATGALIASLKQNQYLALKKACPQD